MQLSLFTPEKALKNRGYDKQSLTRTQVESLKQSLARLSAGITDTQDEEYHKNLISDLLKDVYYRDEYHINVNKKQDLVIRTGKSVSHPVGVILEFKKPSNKTEMVSLERPNVKALQELVLYYLRERWEHNNTSISHLVATNVHEWFVFDEKHFNTFFAQNSQLKQDYIRWNIAGKNTDYFYKSIAAPAIDAIVGDLPCMHLRLKDYSTSTDNSEETERQLTTLYKVLSPEMLLKLPVANDSNSLNKDFYHELLHLLGLEEYKDKAKKTIRRKPDGKRHEGALLENTIALLQSRHKLANVQNLDKYGTSEEEQLFGVGLELVITWLNRILFLKLLEAQLLNYHRKNPTYAFLNMGQVRDFDDLNELFFDVLAVETPKRTPSVRKKYAFIPYLNSSLFEVTALEEVTFEISSLKDRFELPLYRATILKDDTGKRKLTGQKLALSYLFEFLNAFDFSSEGSSLVREEGKALINASVLGLIFEKINGYQEGAFYTPGFITMYMCHETLRSVVIRKFNEHYGWECNTFDDLRDRVHEGNASKRAEANQIINSIRCADIAVGSGHYLVSALNELLAMKSDLGILSYSHDNARVKTCQLRVEYDELKVYDEDGLLIQYHAPTSKEALTSPRQRIQETIFHEKKTLIENCLFGVDINPNSVKICCLRLWIELLKHAYYQLDAQGEGFELRTLPNLDINIRCGNSVISRFELNHTSNVLPKDRLEFNGLIEQYQGSVKLYKHGQGSKRKLREEMERVKQAITHLLVPSDKEHLALRQAQAQLNQIPLLASDEERERWTLQKEEWTRQLVEIEKLYDDKRRALYSNAFEWRFEFTEVLDKEGNYLGFDAVIGNPPYIRQEELGKWKPYLQKHYSSTYAGTADLFVYFVERGITLLQPNGYFSYIIANKWMRAGYGKALRQYLRQMRLTQLIDFGDLPVFEEASTYPCILSLQKNDRQTEFMAAEVNTLTFEHELADYLSKKFFLMTPSSLHEEGWQLGDQGASDLLQKLRRIGTPLGQYVNGKVYRGVLTGLNEAFVIDQATKDRLIAEDARSAEIIKPFLAGWEVKRYNALSAEEYLLFFPKGWTRKNTNSDGEDLNWQWLSKHYPAITRHLMPFAPQGRKRTDKGEFWWELRACGYYSEFEQHKIIYPNISKGPEFTYDTQSFYTNQKCFIINSQDKFLLGVLNSKLSWFLFEMVLPKLRGNFYEPSYKYFKDFPIPSSSSEVRRRIAFLADQILDNKQNSQADTSGFENEIDQLVYELYDLTEEEIQMVEKSGSVKTVAPPVSIDTVISA